ncbi:MAG: hypothetical protein CL927_20615 [Deltaproteobacteria bacterium]|nr:hypothetical protein [Deltaproteobacteria bacterium]HCH66332.1 hypothetical protein [Deltaproteobacteria bacterium]
MTPLEPNRPSRRELMEQLSTLLGGAALGPLAACSSTKNRPSKPVDGTEAVDEAPTDPPKIDLAATSDALGLALAALPLGTDADALLANVQAEIDALHAAGLTETAQWTATCIDEVFTPMVGNLAGILPVNGSVDEETARRMGRELIDSLRVGMAALSPKLDEVSEELKEALGGDTSDPAPEVTASLAEHEVFLRQWMHSMDAGEGNLSGQAAAMAMMNQMQAARARSASPQSVDGVTAQVKQALGIFGAEEATEATERSAQRAARDHTPPTWRRQGYEATPPPDLELECNTIQNIFSLVDSTVNLVSTLKNLSAAQRAASSDMWRARASDLDWEVDRADDIFLRTLRIEVGGVAQGNLVGALRSLVEGEAQEGWAASIEEECNWYAAFFLTILLLWQIAQALMTLMTIITKLGAELALATGIYAPAPLLAGTIIFVIMLSIIVLYVLNIVCMVVDLIPALEAVFLQCEP